MARDIRAGLAFVEVVIDNRQVASGLATSRRMLLDFSIFASGIRDKLSPARLFKGLGEGMQKFGKAQLIRGGLVAAALVPIVKVASDARETANKFKAVFLGDAGSIGAWVVTLGDRIGRSKIELQDSLSTYQAFFKGLQFGGKEAAGLSKKMQKASLDFASFFNISDREASGRFISALSGSSEVLDRFGINIKIAALQAELAAMGINKSWSKVTEPEKVMARINIILKSMDAQGAIGDAFKTRGEFANLLKKIAGAAKDAAAAIGSGLLPVLKPLAAELASLLSRFAEWAKANQGMIRRIASLGVRFIALGLALVVVGKGLALFGGLLSISFMIFKLGLAIKLIAPFLPMLFGIAKAMSFASVATGAMTLSLSGLKLMAGAVLLPMLKLTLAVGGLTLVIGALAAVWINAEIQGITFGQSVLDLTNRITGLKNAFTSLREEQNRTVKERKLEGGDLFNRPAEDFGSREHKEEALAVRERLVSEKAKATAKLPGLEQQRERLKNKAVGGLGAHVLRRQQLQEIDQAILDTRSRISTVGARLISVDALLTRIGESPLAGVNRKSDLNVDAIFEHDRAMRQAERVLRAPLKIAILQGIVDPEERQIALAKQEFADKRAGVNVRKAGFLRLEEEQVIKNIQDKFARERAEGDKRRIEERLRQETDLEREIERLKINNALSGRKRTIALLALQEKHALADAGETDKRLIRAKFALLREGGAQDVSRQIRGTFSATAAAGLGGSGPVIRVAKAAEKTAKLSAEIAITLDKILREQERIALEANA